MAGNSKLHGSSNLSFFLQPDSICSPSFHPSAGFLCSGSQSISFDDQDEIFLHQPEKKRRLTVDQVRLLEQSFEIENKLEPERKVQLAKDLALRPRQVAIWFQNRRARWKTTQLEKEYDALKSSLDELKIEHEKLLMEKERLEAEVLSLTDELLLKEKDGNGSLESFELQKLQSKLQSFSSCLISPAEKPSSEPGGGGGGGAENQWKQEDLRTSNSIITLESESPDYSMIMSCPSNAFGGEQSEVSKMGEDYHEVKGCSSLLDLENNPCSHPFEVGGDHSFWFWP